MDVRSEWEIQTVDCILENYPNLEIETNNRTIIPSRKTRQRLEINIYIPSLRLGFELNGEPYHNHDQYRIDKENGTSISEEMYKEKYCAKKGIRLINLWSSSRESTNLNKIDMAIQDAIDGDRISPTVPFINGLDPNILVPIGLIILIVIVTIVLFFVFPPVGAFPWLLIAVFWIAILVKSIQ